MSEFGKTCTYCKEKIKLSDKTGKWLPYNLDGSDHDCRTNKNENKKEPENKIKASISNIDENTNANPILTAKEMLDRLRSVGINLDLKLFLEKTTANAEKK